MRDLIREILFGEGSLADLIRSVIWMAFAGLPIIAVVVGLTASTMIDPQALRKCAANWPDIDPLVIRDGAVIVDRFLISKGHLPMGTVICHHPFNGETYVVEPAR